MANRAGWARAWHKPLSRCTFNEHKCYIVALLRADDTKRRDRGRLPYVGLRVLPFARPRVAGAVDTRHRPVVDMTCLLD